jgi:glutaredoxin 3
MMRVKVCLWLTFFACILFITVIYIFGRRNTEDKMGSLFSSSKSVPSSDLSVADHIQELIHKYPVVVFSKSYCPYSKKAKDILSKYKLDKNYHVVELDQLPSKTDEYQDELGKLTGARTVPRVFINGDLERLLKEAKAIVD